MSYFYFNPRNPQYFFPENFKDHPFFLTMFQPYTSKAKVVWWIWRNFLAVRKIYAVDNIEKYIPETLIRSKLAGSPLLLFNSGSPGPEQKVTALGIQNNVQFFLKFGQTEIAKKNVLNEAKILSQLGNLDYVPRVLEVIENMEFTLLKTTVLNGSRFEITKLNNENLNTLIRINSLQVETSLIYGKSTKKVFSHGDYCPWNLLIFDGVIQVFDWELAGNYPLGYDLFTFIFQTSFLLNPKIIVNQLIKQNIHFISYYFNAFEVKDWNGYLLDFAEVKLELEIKKRNDRLISKYKELLVHAKKA